MKTFLIVLAAFLSSPLFMATSCEQQQKQAQAQQKKQNCEGAICTEIFVMISVKVSQQNGVLNLDEVYTTRKSSNEKLTFDQNMGPDSYIVLDDSYIQKMQNTTDEFHFIGIKNGEKLIDEVYTISADCCHVNKEKGKERIDL